MKTKILFSLLLMFLAVKELAAQKYIAMARAAGSKDWGYIDQTGKEVIKAQYRDCYSFSPDGFAVIEVNKQPQFIDTKGKVLNIGLKSFSLKSFSFGFGIGEVLLSFDNGLAPVREKKDFGFVNTSGKMQIPMKYENVSGFQDGYAYAIAKGKFYIINTEGEESEIKASGITEIKRPSNEMAAFRGKDDLMGFVDMSGKVVIDAKFDAVGNFVSGLAWAKNKEGLAGFIDKTGNWAIKAQYSAANDFDPVSEIARVKDASGAWGYIKKDGAAIKLNIKTDVYDSFEEGLAKGREDKKFGFFGPDGNWVIKPQFDAVGKISAGYIAVKEGDLWGFIDTKGNWVIKPKYEGVREMVKLNDND